jgi:hypothetical protein
LWIAIERKARKYSSISYGNQSNRTDLANVRFGEVNLGLLLRQHRARFLALLPVRRTLEHVVVFASVVFPLALLHEQVDSPRLCTMPGHGLAAVAPRQRAARDRLPANIDNRVRKPLWC